MTSIEIKEARIKLYGDNSNSFGRWANRLGYKSTGHLRRFELSEESPIHEKPSQITINLIKVLLKVKDMELNSPLILNRES